jgi:superfamily II DNA/RNA helicase
LVATDIAARGIHVDNVALVIHADPPSEHKAYLHRSGRTARAGNDGIVVTLMTSEQSRDVRDLTRRAGIKPMTTRVAGTRHAVLTDPAPGERERPGALVMEVPVTQAQPQRSASHGGSNNRRRRPHDSGQQTSRPGANGSRRRRPGNGMASRGPRSAAEFSAGRR